MARIGVVRQLIRKQFAALAPEHNYQKSVELITKRVDFLSDDERQQLSQWTAEQVFFGRAAKQ